ncbi:PIR Superfamily Protein [Plasmodium ovale wallikeri]|uniref:PIR Superfamily Protein n=1 Tax=Plasmodium ovale wallikeri TaxID=864142 RepID=A0A1A9ANG1_PLAOA|nr:PIR Superfamily Protein [Plasmodium ovale wallikeri]SBT57735.1 PIR Superfamily Protein [Plasmodium ovale wallikeri]
MNMIARSAELSEIYEWSKNLNGYLINYFNLYVDKWSDKNIKKRCRDFNYIFNTIIREIEENDMYSTHYTTLNNSINNYITIQFQNHRLNCEKALNDSEEYADIEYGKKINDLCEDFYYINNKLGEINNSYQCEEIFNYIEGQKSSLKTVYEDRSHKYSQYLVFHDFPSYNDFDNIKKNIKCKS